MKGILQNLAFPSVPAVPAAPSPVLCLGGPIGRRCCRVIRQKRCPYLGASASATATAAPGSGLSYLHVRSENLHQSHTCHKPHTHTHTRKQKAHRDKRGKQNPISSSLKLGLRTPKRLKDLCRSLKNGKQEQHLYFYLEPFFVLETNLTVDERKEALSVTQLGHKVQLTKKKTPFVINFFSIIKQTFEQHSIQLWGPWTKWDFSHSTLIILILFLLLNTCLRGSVWMWRNEKNKKWHQTMYEPLIMNGLGPCLFFFFFFLPS